MNIGNVKKIFLWTLMGLIAFSNFAVLFGAKTANAAGTWNDPPYAYNPNIQTLTDKGHLSSNAKTIRITWGLNVESVWKTVNKVADAQRYDGITLQKTDVEVKFLVRIDGKLLDQKYSDVTDGASSTGTYGCPLLNVTANGGDAAIYNFNGEIQEGSAPDNSASFAIGGPVSDVKGYSLTLIDNVTIPKLDPQNKSPHTYELTPLIRLKPRTGTCLISIPPKLTVEVPAGSTASVNTHPASWYKDNYFPNPANFFIGTGGTTMTGSGTDWTIHIPGSGKRPAIDFKLKYIVSFSGAKVRNTNELVFVSTDPNSSNLAILVNDGYFGNIVPGDRLCDKNVSYPFAAIEVTPSASAKDGVTWDTIGNVDLFFSGTEYGKQPSTKEANNIYYKMLNDLYTGGPFGPGKCPNSGDLTDAAKKLQATDASNTAATTPSSQWMNECGITTNIFSVASASWWIGQALCGIIQAIGSVADWLTTALFQSVFSAYHSVQTHLALSPPLLINYAHAAGAALHITSDPSVSTAVGQKVTIKYDLSDIDSSAKSVELYISKTDSSDRNAIKSDFVAGGSVDTSSKTMSNTYYWTTTGKESGTYHFIVFLLDKDEKVINHAAIDLILEKPTGTTGAPDDAVTPLRSALTNNPANTWPWVISTWKFVLVLTNLFLVVILLFLGIVNILHIQYDTYAIKKMLPLLIIGVVLANFSLVICRMLIDASNILTNSFMGSSAYGSDPGAMVKDLITAMKFSTVKDHSFFTNFTGAWQTVGILLLATAFALFSTAAFLILGVMFYIRYAAIVMFAVAAPLAFVAMAFPPTQSLFKQWWSWMTKFVFMKPIAFFFLFVALQVKGDTNSVTSLTAWIIIVFLVYCAILVPWKLGGAITAAWGGAMGSVFGTKKGGWARKPVDDWWQRRKDQAGALAKTKAPRLFAGAAKDRAVTEDMKKAAESAVGMQAMRNPAVIAWRQRAKQMENDLNSLTNMQAQSYDRGELKMSWLLRGAIGGVKWQGLKPGVASQLDLAAEKAQSEEDLNLATKNLDATEKDLLYTAVFARGNRARTLIGDLNAMKEAGEGMDLYEIDENGALVRKEEYEQDDNGAYKIDENGNPIRKLGTYQSTMEMATQLRMRALTLPPEEAAKAEQLMKSANELERQAQNFAISHRAFNGKPIRYEDFMDRQYFGRTLSVTAPIAAEDSQILSNYESPKSMRERLDRGGGNRNLRFGSEAGRHIFRGEYDQLDDLTRSAFIPDRMAWSQLIGRGGNLQNRGEVLSEFLGYLKTIYSPEEWSQFMGGVIKTEESLRGNEGLTAGFLAEQLLAARRRGVNNLPGFPEGIIDLNDESLKVGNNLSTEKIAARLREHQDEINKFLIDSPEFFASIEVSPFGQRNSFNFVDGIARTINNSKLLGTGNAVNNTMGQGFNLGEFLTDLNSTDPRRISALRRQRAEEDKKRQRMNSQLETLSSGAQQLRQDPAEASRFINLPETQEAANNLRLRQTVLTDQIKIGATSIDSSTFQDAIADAITSSAATSFDELQTQLSQQFNGLNLDITPQMNTPEGFEAFKKEVAEVSSGIRTYIDLEQTANASQMLQYVPVSENETVTNLTHNLEQLETAINHFGDALQQKNATGVEIPKEVTDGLIDAISTRQQMTPLSKSFLESNPERSTEILEYLRTTLRSALALKQQGQSLTQENLLRQIKVSLNQRMNNSVSQGTQYQRPQSAARQQTPPAAPAQPQQQPQQPVQPAQEPPLPPDEPNNPEAHL